MTEQNKLLFIDRDGTLIIEPEDKQIDSLEKLAFIDGVIPALLRLKAANYQLIMVSNQDGLGTASFPQATFHPAHNLMLQILRSQGILFEEILICPHTPDDHCECRKPKVGLVRDYLNSQVIDRNYSYVIGDRETDLALAANMGIKGIKLGDQSFENWQKIADAILLTPRTAEVQRKTNETDINAVINLDQSNQINIQTGIGFFDHMLEQLIKHGGFSATIAVTGDLHIDDHHTVEDTAITLGTAIRQALGDKLGIARYGFLLPMDEAQAQVAIDLSGRSYFVFNGKFSQEKIGELSTELIPHFFHSLAQSLGCALHIDVRGENNHHMAEAMFKAVGRALKQALHLNGHELPTTKGVL